MVATLSSNRVGMSARKKNADRVISRRSVRGLLRRDGRKDEITQAGFNLLAKIGNQTMQKLVMAAKNELVHTLGPRGAKTTVTTKAMCHAANCVKIPGSITQEAINALRNKSYDTRAMRRSAAKRIVQNHGGKKRTRSEVAPFMYCVVMVIIDEIISQIQEKRVGKNIRIKNEHIYSVIKHDKSKLLTSPHLKEMVGAGMSFV